MPSGNNEYGSKAVLPRDRFTIHILYSFFTEKPRPSGCGFFVSILIHPSLAFSSAEIISSARLHPQLAFLCRRDDFFRSDSSLSCSFSPQGLLLPLRRIPSLLFCAAGMISSAQMHLYLALSHHRDYCDRPDSSPACFFVPQGLLRPPGFISILLFSLQGLFPPPGFIPSLLFCTAGMISSARIHLYLALPCRRDYFRCPDSSPACFFVPQG